MKNSAIAMVIGLCGFTASTLASLQCHYNVPANKPFKINLAPCYKPFVLPFPEHTRFQFMDNHPHPATVAIQGDYLVGSGVDGRDLDLFIYKRNDTLGIQGEVIVHYNN